MSKYSEKSGKLAQNLGTLALAMALAGFAPKNTSSAQEPGASPSEIDVAPRSNVLPTQAGEGVLPSEVSEREGLAALQRATRALDDGENAEEESIRRSAYERAFREAQRAVEILPNNADARFAAFGSEGRLVELNGLAAVALALPSLNRQLDVVLELNPDHPAALAARGGMLMKLPWLLGGDTAKGVRTLERAVSLNPKGAGTLLELAEAYEIVGRESEAIEAGRTAIALARAKGEADKAARAARFVTKLEESCKSCPATEAVPLKSDSR